MNEWAKQSAWQRLYLHSN